MRWYEKSAELGSDWAQNSMGLMYQNGRGVDVDNQKAFDWYMRAAQQGYPDGMNNVGYFYDLGLGVDQNSAEAVRWYRAAADTGMARAQNNLGIMYADGTGVPQDYEEAVKWYRLAADQGLPEGQNSLGYSYDLGLGVPQDSAEAVRWYRLAADQGHMIAQSNLGSMYADGSGVPEDDVEAVRWYREAADQGYAPGQRKLGNAYAYGEGVTKDETEAVRWWTLAADQGDTDAQIALASAYERGEGVVADTDEAKKWRETAGGDEATVDFSDAETVATSDACDVSGLPTVSTSENRVALVIGNSAYQHAPALPNPTCDAQAMAKMLKAVGFTVVLGTDLDKPAMEAKAREFAKAATTADTALFFYAGHGLQVDGRNYLVPIDATVEDATSISFELMDIENVTNFMTGFDERTGQEKVAIVLLDACRDNPFAQTLKRSLGASRSNAVDKGLAAIGDGGGMIIGFATAPGDVAADGEGNHSPFTTALLELLPTPGVEFQTLMTRVKAKVVEFTRKKERPQRPWTNSDLTTEFYLVPAT